MTAAVGAAAEVGEVLETFPVEAVEGGAPVESVPDGAEELSTLWVADGSGVPEEVSGPLDVLSRLFSIELNSGVTLSEFQWRFSLL